MVTWNDAAVIQEITETYGMPTGIAKRFGGSYGLGIIYAKTMFGAPEAH